jgi:hypothetical protein
VLRIAIEHSLLLRLRKHFAVFLRRRLIELLAGDQHPLLSLDADCSGLGGSDGFAPRHRQEQNQNREYSHTESVEKIAIVRF